jgi:hypothetical protein
MKRSTLFLFGIALAAAAYSMITATQLAAQSLNFSNVIAFASNQGRLCFFDQANGKLYVYDGEGKACLFQGQLKELGKPFESVQKTTSVPAIERRMDPGTKVMINDKGEKTVVLGGPQAGN